MWVGCSYSLIWVVGECLEIVVKCYLDGLFLFWLCEYLVVG